MRNNPRFFIEADDIKQEVSFPSSSDELLPSLLTPSITSTLRGIAGKQISEDEKMHLPLKIFDGKKASITDLTEASSSYLWLRRIKEIFLVFGTNAENDPLIIHDTNYTRNEMIETTEIFLKNAKPKQRTPGQIISKKDEETWEAEQLAVHNFQRKFYSQITNMKTNLESTIIIDPETNRPMDYSNSIWWYSWKEAFIYRQINNILRMENLELLMSYRYFISDLCQMIKRYYDDQHAQRPLMVFRAEWIDQSQLNSLKEAVDKKGRLISMNGFISTTIDRSIATFYANRLCSRQNVVPIVYEITIDPSKSCTEFACIENISYHPEEKEVLFSIGAAFSMDSIHNPVQPNHFYTVQLTACEYNESMIDDMKLKLRKYTQSELYILLNRYLIELEQYRSVKKSLIHLLNNKDLVFKDDPSLASAYNCMGSIYLRQQLFGDAMLNFKEALKYQVRLDSSNNNALAECYNNIGSVLLEQKYFHEALENLQKALRIQNRESIYKKHLTAIHTNLGRCYTRIQNYDQAKKHFLQTDQLIEQNKRVVGYDALGKALIEADAQFYKIVFEEQYHPESYSDAYAQILKLYENILPSSHSKFLKTMKHFIIYHYSHRCDILQELTYEKTVSTFSNRLPVIRHTDQLDQLELFNLLASLYANDERNHSDQRFDAAMKYWKKNVRPMFYLNCNNNQNYIVKNLVYGSYIFAIEHYKQKQQISEIILNLGILFALQGDIDNAISYLTQVLNDGNDPFICSILLGNLHAFEKNYSTAIEYYNRALSVVDENDQYMKIELCLVLAECDQDNALEILKQLKKDIKLLRNDLDDEIIKVRAVFYEKLAYELIETKEFDTAILYANKGKNLKLKFLSNNHPDLAKSYILIGKIFEEKQQFREALKQYEEAIEIQYVNLPHDHIDIIKLKLEIGHLHCKMKKFDKIEQNFIKENKLYSTIDYFQSIVKLRLLASQLYEKADVSEKVCQCQMGLIKLRQYQWPKIIIERLTNCNINVDENSDYTINIVDRIETIPENTEDELKQLLPTSREQLKAILQNFYYIYTELDAINQRKQITDDSQEINEKIHNIKALLFSFWSSSEKRSLDRYTKSKLIMKSWLDILQDQKTSILHEEYEFKLSFSYKPPIALDFLQDEKQFSQYLSLFVYGLNYDFWIVNEYVDDENVSEKQLLDKVKSLLDKHVHYGKQLIEANIVVDATKIFIRALQLREHYLKLTNHSIDNNKSHRMITDFINDLRDLSSSCCNPIIDILNNNLCHYFPANTTMKLNDQIWLLLKMAILNKQHQGKEKAIRYYNECIELMKQSESSTSTQIATIQYSLGKLLSSSVTPIPDDISPIDSLLLAKVINKAPELNKQILALNNLSEYNFFGSQPQCIGQSLFDMGDYDTAEVYWYDVLQQQSELISKFLFDMIFSSSKTVQEIHKEMKRANHEFISELNLIIPNYIKIALIYLQQGNTKLSEPPGFPDYECACKYYQQSISSLNTAKIILNIINVTHNEISNQCDTLLMDAQKKFEYARKFGLPNCHSHVKCNHCQGAILDIRYMCDTCNDQKYNLCQDCVALEPNHFSTTEPQHQLVKLPYEHEKCPNPECKKPINNSFFKCRKCYYAFCATCVVEHTKHQDNLIKIDPYSVICCQCKSIAVHQYYTCTICPNYNLCADCSDTHTNHQMIRMAYDHYKPCKNCQENNIYINDCSICVECYNVDKLNV